VVKDEITDVIINTSKDEITEVIINNNKRTTKEPILFYLRLLNGSPISFTSSWWESKPAHHHLHRQPTPFP